MLGRKMANQQLCLQADHVLRNYCNAGRMEGWPAYFCDSWRSWANNQCGEVPCEQQLCSWLGACPSCGKDSGNVSETASVCSFVASDPWNSPYLVTRVFPRCPLQFEGMPLFEATRVSPEVASDVLGVVP